MPAVFPNGDKIYSGRTDTLSNTHKTASNASGNPITSQTPIFGFISYPVCFRRRLSASAPFSVNNFDSSALWRLHKKKPQKLLCQIVAARAICAKSCRRIAHSAVTTRHNICVTMRTLTMPMNPDDLLSAPACRALWLHHSALFWHSRAVHLCLAISLFLTVWHIRSLNPLLCA